MEATARLVDAAIPEVVFEDGLGIRFLITDPSGAPSTEVLVLRPGLTAVPSFEFVLRERVARLGSFSHPSFALLRGVDRTGGAEPGLRMRSDAVEGTRLSRLIENAQTDGVFLDINTALYVTRQVVAAIAALHERGRDLSHGAIALERLVVTPQGRVIVVEHGLGAALQQLRYSPERYWNELRLALPASGGALLFDQRVDVIQIGVVALALILGRPLNDGELPAHASDLVATARAVSLRGGVEPLLTGLRGWLARALQLDPLRSFASALDARNDLDTILGSTDDLASSSSLEALLDRLDRSALMPGDTWRRQPDPEEAAALDDFDDVDDLEETEEGAEPEEPEVRQEFEEHELRGDVVLADIDEALARATTDGSPVLRFAPQSLPAGLQTDRGQATIDVPSADDEEDDEDDVRPTPTKGARRRVWQGVAAGVVSASIAAIAGVKAASRVPMEAPVALAPGTLELSSGPSGVEAFVDGAFRGLTPLSLALAPGVHIIELHRPSAEPQSIPITLSSGMKISQYAEVPLVMGIGLEAADLAGATDEGTGDPSHLMPVSLPAETGWVSIVSDATLQLLENDVPIGSSRDRVELPSGRHELTLVDAASGINTTRVVQVETTKTAVIKVATPVGALSVSASPRAEVWVDGDKRGDTPLGSFTLRAGAHDIVVRHPELGEHRRAVVVTAGELLRVSVDLRAK